MHSVTFYLVFIGRMNALRQTSVSLNNAFVRLCVGTYRQQRMETNQSVNISSH